jgi:hypothetical protein
MAASRGFDIVNLSSHRIKLLNITGDGNFEGRPPDGAVLHPGVGRQRVEVQYRLFSKQVDTAHYEILDRAGFQFGIFTVTMTVDAVGDAYLSCQTTHGRCHRDGTTAELRDPLGTVIDIGAGQGEDQARALESFCQTDNAATCTFTPTFSDTRFQTALHTIGAPANNTSAQPRTFLIGGPDRVGITASIPISVSTEVRIADVVSAGLKATYNRTWIKEHTFTPPIVTVTVLPQYTAWLEGTEPLVRETGHFTMELGNTTWHLRDVYFDGPNPSPRSVGVYFSCLRADAGGPASCRKL